VTVKQFRCGDVVLGCDWVARNEDEGELFEEIQVHAREAHGMDEVPPEVVETIQGVITEVEA
jgi:predicted small metal-binding protein